MAKLITNLSKSSKNKSHNSNDDDIDLDNITSDVRTDDEIDDDSHEAQTTYNIGEIDIAEVADEGENDMNLNEEIKKIVGKKDSIDEGDDHGVWVNETDLEVSLDSDDDFLDAEKYDPENTDEDYDE